MGPPARGISARDLYILILELLPPRVPPDDNVAVLPASAIDQSMIFGDPPTRKQW